MTPTVADYRTSNLLILRVPATARVPVTAEVASSSLVVPAILSKRVTGRDTGNSNPQLNPQLLIHCCAHPYSVEEFALCGPCFVAVFLRIQIERRLNLAVTQDSLHGLGFDLRLVHQPVAKRVTQVVKSEPLAVIDVYSGFLC